eukprot:g1669.t1
MIDEILNEKLPSHVAKGNKVFVLYNSKYFAAKVLEIQKFGDVMVEYNVDRATEVVPFVEVEYRISATKPTKRKIASGKYEKMEKAASLQTEEVLLASSEVKNDNSSNCKADASEKKKASVRFNLLIDNNSPKVKKKKKKKGKKKKNRGSRLKLKKRKCKEKKGDFMFSVSIGSQSQNSNISTLNSSASSYDTSSSIISDISNTAKVCSLTVLSQNSSSFLTPPSCNLSSSLSAKCKPKESINVSQKSNTCEVILERDKEPNEIVEKGEWNVSKEKKNGECTGGEKLFVECGETTEEHEEAERENLDRDILKNDLIETAIDEAVEPVEEVVSVKCSQESVEESNETDKVIINECAKAGEVIIDEFIKINEEPFEEGVNGESSTKVDKIIIDKATIEEVSTDKCTKIDEQIMIETTKNCIDVSVKENVDSNTTHTYAYNLSSKDGLLLFYNDLKISAKAASKNNATEIGKTVSLLNVLLSLRLENIHETSKLKKLINRIERKCKTKPIQMLVQKLISEWNLSSETVSVSQTIKKGSENKSIPSSTMPSLESKKNDTAIRSSTVPLAKSVKRKKSSIPLSTRTVKRRYFTKPKEAASTRAGFSSIKRRRFGFARKKNLHSLSK